jgi:hypothetical protein
LWIEDFDFQNPISSQNKNTGIKYRNDSSKSKQQVNLQSKLAIMFAIIDELVEPNIIRRNIGTNGQTIWGLPLKKFTETQTSKKKMPHDDVIIQKPSEVTTNVLKEPVIISGLPFEVPEKSKQILWQRTVRTLMPTLLC